MKEYKEEDYLQLSGIQHFRFCRRQWALIHIENQWEENLRTVEGTILHERVHNSDLSESRKGTIITRNMRLFSPSLGISGNCDIVEFRSSKSGISLNGKNGNYQPYPIEYKHGSPKSNDVDNLQLCAQAMCLEEMLCCNIPKGAFYYGEIKHRVEIPLTDKLRSDVKVILLEMHDLYRRGYTPKVRPTKSCNACSLKDLCLPKLMRNKSVHDYIQIHLEN